MEEEFVYPGHPVQIAYKMAQIYATFEEANAVGFKYPAALENGHVRGAGGSVFTALALVRRVRTGELSIEDYGAMADECWGRVDGNATDPKRQETYQKGLDVAKRLLPLLLATGWVRGPDPIVDDRFSRLVGEGV